MTDIILVVNFYWREKLRKLMDDKLSNLDHVAFLSTIQAFRNAKMHSRFLLHHKRFLVKGHIKVTVGLAKQFSSQRH